VPWIIPEHHPAPARWNDANNPKSSPRRPMSDACESWSIWAVLNRRADRIGDERNQPCRPLGKLHGWLDGKSRFHVVG
jgi:hypothetical protein